MKEKIRNISRVICIVLLFFSIVLVKGDDKTTFVVAITNLSCFFAIADMFFSVASNNLRNAEFIEKYKYQRIPELHELKSWTNNLKQKYGRSSYEAAEKEQYQKTCDLMVERVDRLEKYIRDFSSHAPQHRKHHIIWRNVGRLICIAGIATCTLMFCYQKLSRLMFSIADYATVVGFILVLVIQALNAKYLNDAKEDEAETEKGDERIRQVRGEIVKRL